MKTTESKSPTRFIVTNQGCTTRFTTTNESGDIDKLSIEGNRAIKEVLNNGNVVNNSCIMNADSKRSIKVELTKFINLVLSKKSKIGFFIFRAKLVNIY